MMIIRLPAQRPFFRYLRPRINTANKFLSAHSSVALRFGAKLWAPLDSPGAAKRRHIWLANLSTQHAVRRDFGRRRGFLQRTPVLIAELQLGCAKQPPRQDAEAGRPAKG